MTLEALVNKSRLQPLDSNYSMSFPSSNKRPSIGEIVITGESTPHVKQKEHNPHHISITPKLSKSSNMAASASSNSSDDEIASSHGSPMRFMNSPNLLNLDSISGHMSSAANISQTLSVSLSMFTPTSPSVSMSQSMDFSNITYDNSTHTHTNTNASAKKSSKKRKKRKRAKKYHSSPGYKFAQEFYKKGKVRKVMRNFTIIGHTEARLILSYFRDVNIMQIEENDVALGYLEGKTVSSLKRILSETNETVQRLFYYGTDYNPDVLKLHVSINNDLLQPLSSQAPHASARNKLLSTSLDFDSRDDSAALVHSYAYADVDEATPVYTPSHTNFQSQSYSIDTHHLGIGNQPHSAMSSYDFSNAAEGNDRPMTPSASISFNPLAGILSSQSPSKATHAYSPKKTTKPILDAKLEYVLNASDFSLNGNDNGNDDEEEKDIVVHFHNNDSAKKAKWLEWKNKNKLKNKNMRKYNNKTSNNGGIRHRSTDHETEQSENESGNEYEHGHGHAKDTNEHFVNGVDVDADTNADAKTDSKINIKINGSANAADTDIRTNQTPNALPNFEINGRVSLRRLHSVQSSHGSVWSETAYEQENPFGLEPQDSEHEFEVNLGNSGSFSHFKDGDADEDDYKHDNDSSDDGGFVLALEAFRASFTTPPQSDEEIEETKDTHSSARNTTFSDFLGIPSIADHHPSVSMASSVSLGSEYSSNDRLKLVGVDDAQQQEFLNCPALPELYDTDGDGNPSEQSVLQKKRKQFELYKQTTIDRHLVTITKKQCAYYDEQSSFDWSAAQNDTNTHHHDNDNHSHANDAARNQNGHPPHIQNMSTDSFMSDIPDMPHDTHNNPTAKDLLTYHLLEARNVPEHRKTYAYSHY